MNPLYSPEHVIIIFPLGGDNYRAGSIRLVGGPYNWEGRVEIFWSGSWGAISDSSWTDDDANVVCKQLQHSSSYYGKIKPCLA